MSLLTRTLPTVAFALSLATPLASQTRQVRTLSADGATAALTAAVAEAKRNNWLLSIAIVDPAGELLAFARMDGAGISTIENALGKARTSARFRQPTQRFDSLASVRPGLLTFDNMTAVEGGVPIVVEGVVVGAIGVSGASSAQDAQVGRAAAAAVRP